jgi:hypothetical protein
MAKGKKDEGKAPDPRDAARREKATEDRERAARDAGQRGKAAEDKNQTDKNQADDAVRGQQPAPENTPATDPVGEGVTPVERKEGETPERNAEQPTTDGQPIPTAQGARQPDQTDPNAIEPSEPPQTPRTAQTFAQQDQPDTGPLRLDEKGRPKPTEEQIAENPYEGADKFKG